MSSTDSTTQPAPAAAAPATAASPTPANGEQKDDKEVNEVAQDLDRSTIETPEEGTPYISLISGRR